MRMARRFLMLFVLFNSAIQISCFAGDLGEPSTPAVIPLDGESFLDSGDLAPGGLARSPMAASSRRVHTSTAKVDRDSLESKLLRKELQKLPFSQHELGEGVATREQMKKADGLSMFMKMADKIQKGKKRVEADLSKTAAEKTKMEQKELEARTQVRDLKHKLKQMVSTEKYQKAQEESKKLKEQLEEYQSKMQSKTPEQLIDEVQETKRVVEEEKQKESRLELKLSKSRQDEEEKLREAKAAEETELSQETEAIKKKYYLDMNQITTWKRKVAESKDELKDLRDKVKDSEKKEQHMKKGLEEIKKEELDEAKQEAEKKLKSEKLKENGLAQKLDWDKRTVLKAKEEKKAEGKVMAAALDQKKALEQTEEKERTALKEAKHDAKTQQELDQSNLQKKELENVIEHEKVKVTAEEKEAIEKQAQEEVKEKEEESKAAITAAKEKFVADEEKLKSKIENLKKELHTAKQIEDSDVRKAKDKVMLQDQDKLSSMEHELQKAEDEEEHTMRAKLEDDEKIKNLRASLEDEKQQEENILSKEKAEAANFKQVLQSEEKRLQKRIGARQEAAMLKQEAGSKDSEIKELVKRSKVLEDTVKKNADEKSNLEKKFEKEQDKSGQAQYKVALAKEKEKALGLEYKKLKVKYEMMKQHAAHTDHDSDAEESLAAEAEKKYQTELQVSQAAVKEVDLLKARQKLMETRSLRLEERADKYRQEKSDEIENTKRVADAVRTRWSTKLITEEAKHAKALMQLKHKLEKSELETEKKLEKSHEELDKAKAETAKAKNKVRGLQLSEQYAVDVVGKQQVQAKVAQAYVDKMTSIRQRYNKEFEKAYADEIRDLKKKITGFQNGHTYAKLKYKILMMEEKLRAKSAGATVPTTPAAALTSASATPAGASPVAGAPPVPNSNGSIKHPRSKQVQRPADMNTLLSLSLDKLDKDAAHETQAEHRNRVSKVVNAIVAHGIAQERAQAEDIMRDALAKGSSSQPTIAVGPKDHEEVRAVEPNAFNIQT